jgi:hypothetical protein
MFFCAPCKIPLTETSLSLNVETPGVAGSPSEQPTKEATVPVSSGRSGTAKVPGRSAATAAAKADDKEGNEYSEALARLADDASVTPGEFERAIVLAAAEQTLTPDCITLDEIELFPTLALFPEARRQHVAECRECARFLDAISPRDDEIEKFVEAALAERVSK